MKLICESHNHELVKSLVDINTLEYNANSYTTIKQIYNARSAYRSSIKGSCIEMQQLMKLLERDQYIHWHRLKDEDVVRDIFWCHPDAMKLCNACNLIFLIDSTYKTNRYKLSLLDFVSVTLTWITFSAGLFLKRDALPRVIVTGRDLALMNAVKIVFPECTNLLCRFHIDKNVKAKCKSLVGQKNGSLVDCPFKEEFDECLKKFEIVCSP
ncbi:hypothetical protein GmHk_06G016600 [Glycine max]|nr:hypothetical protein GmHk_06G016600 [Glycine max]